MGPTVIKHFSLRRTPITATPPPAAGAPVAPAAAPAATPSSSNKLWWIAGGVLLLLILALMWTFPPNTWVNWAATTPGQAIEKSLGTGWANWVMWITLVVIVIGIINFFLGDKKGSKIFAALNTGAVIVFVALVVIAINKHFDDPKKATEEESQRVEFNNAPDGYTRMVPARVTDTYIVSMRTAHRGNGETGFWHACPTVISDSLNFKPRFRVVAGAGTSRNHIQMVPEDIDRLINGGSMTTRVTVQFRQTYEPDPAKNPCGNMV